MTEFEEDQRPVEQDATRLSNVGARKDYFIDAFGEMFALDAKIAALVEKHIAPLRAAKNDIRKRLRDDYEVPGKVVAARYASYKLEREAIVNRDETTVDAIREMYEALPAGGIVDLVDALLGRRKQ